MIYIPVILLWLSLISPSNCSYSSWSGHKTSTVPSHCPSQTNPSLPPNGNEWAGWGGNVYNNRWARNSDVSSSNIQKLSQHCRLRYIQGVSAAPALKGNMAYYPTWNGLLVALNFVTCKVQWQINVTAVITNYAPITAEQAINNPVSRTSPQIENGVLYFATLTHALLVAADVETGSVLSTVQINPHPLAVLTMSPTVYQGRIFIGAASNEELAADYVPGYQCCSFVGNMAALTFDRSSKAFSVAWNVSMLPSPPGNWSGAAVWGSQPSIDPIRSQVFIATGNVYSLPDDYILCQNQSEAIKVVAEGQTTDPCLPPNVLQESVIAFDIELGIINWANQLTPLDAWTVACGLPGYAIRNPTLCPESPGPDADFGIAPTFVAGGSGTPYGKDVVIAGQKNGNLYAMSAQAGRVYWSTVTSPGGNLGGLMWGLAVDATRVYFTAVNSLQETWNIQPSNTVINNSAFGAVSLLDGTVEWETQAPRNAVSLQPPTVSNDVAFFGRSYENATGDYGATKGALLILGAGSGSILREIPVDTNYRGGVAVQNKYVLFGSGYSYPDGIEGSFYVYSL